MIKEYCKQTGFLNVVIPWERETAQCGKNVKVIGQSVSTKDSVLRHFNCFLARN